MASTEETPGWLRMVIGYSIWFAIVIVARAVVLSLEGVKELGYAVNPDFFGGGAYPLGLHWLQVIDVVFRTVLILSLLSLGGRLRDVLSSRFPQLPRLGRIGYLAAVLGALILGYFAYAPVVVQPLATQRAEWAYKLIFWVSVAGVLALAVYQFGQMLSAAAKRGAEAGQGAQRAGSSTEEGGTGATCSACGKRLMANAKFCPSCGLAVGASSAASVQASGAPSASGTTAHEVTPQGGGASGRETLKAQTIRLVRSTAAGATVKDLLAQFLEIDRDYGEYKTLLVTFVTPPPQVTKIRFIGIPKAHDVEATALQLLRSNEFEHWDRIEVGDLVVLAEPEGGGHRGSEVTIRSVPPFESRCFV